jgi:RimJ/RimL family protein N-acetyltransferase
MKGPVKHFEIENESICLIADVVTWDTAVFNRRVASISKFALTQSGTDVDLNDFLQWVTGNSIEVVTCRLPHEKLAESMCLEQLGFRFIEMVLHPVAEGLEKFPSPDLRLFVADATKEDLSLIGNIAEQVFRFERYHADPRIDSTLADQRYKRWALSSYASQSQKLVKVVDREQVLIGFFVYEELTNNSVYWHLTAINKDFQGQGLGYQAWLTLISHHKDAGFDTIRTTISARNCPVLNLYSKLGFRFDPPEMTFHWIRET